MLSNHPSRTFDAFGVSCELSPALKNVRRSAPAGFSVLGFFPVAEDIPVLGCLTALQQLWRKLGNETRSRDDATAAGCLFNPKSDSLLWLHYLLFLQYYY